MNPILSFKKPAALFLCASLLLGNNAGYAAPSRGILRLEAEGSPRSFASLRMTQKDPSIQIPSTLGTVEESFTGSSRKKIFYIQDAHDSLEVQENIAKIIHRLVDRADLHTVLEEGYEGPVPSDTYFGTIP